MSTDTDNNSVRWEYGPAKDLPEPENDEALSTEQRLGFLRDDTQALQRDVNELLSILAPLAPVLAALPDLMAKVDPLLKGLKDSPVLKMLGVKL